MQRTWISIICIFICSVTPVIGEANAIIYWKGKRHNVLKKYTGLHKKFKAQLCAPGTEEKYWKIFKDYQGNGKYLPLLPSEKLDKETIITYLPELEKKSQWIRSITQGLRKRTDLGDLLLEAELLEEEVDKLLDFKRAYNIHKKEEALIESRKVLDAFKKRVKNFLNRLDFLHTYSFPADHLTMRQNYDEYKHRKDLAGKVKANEAYFLRKIVEDGAQNPDHSKNDIYMRASINSLYLWIDREEDFLSEKYRFDFLRALKKISRDMAKGKNYILPRLGEWQERVDEMISFYKQVTSKDHKNVKFADSLVEKKSAATAALTSFVHEKQHQTYEFWMKQSELMRAIYVMETILFNEVGDIDGRDALERKDVLQVYVNRLGHPDYSFFSPDDDLYGKLKDHGDEKLRQYPWLNTMFKQGEFSFTYYFISSNIRVFCPDMTKRGKYLRRENVRLALDKLKNPNPKFRAVRYFSRASMIGGIDMSSLWSDFESLPERAGIPVRRHGRKLRSMYRKNKYHYLYDFNDSKNGHYQVLEFRGRAYVRNEDGRYFTYRNPHYFTYFQEKSGLSPAEK